MKLPFNRIESQSMMYHEACALFICGLEEVNVDFSTYSGKYQAKMTRGQFISNLWNGIREWKDAEFSEIHEVF